MASRILILALGLTTAATPLLAAGEKRPATAPAGTAQTRYCMRVEALTESRIEMIRCWTRAEWAEQGVDVDKDWPKEGVRVIG